MARSKVPDWIQPQLATLATSAPAGDDWFHEIKYDGYRLLAWVDGASVRLMTRNRKDWTDRFPAVVRGLAALNLKSAVLDGEVVVELRDGRTSFQALQNVLRETQADGGLRFWVFDALYLAGRDLTGRPLRDRKLALQNVLAGPGEGVVRYSGHVEGQGPAFFAQACRHHLEGIISKRATAPYRGGRGTDWRKVKCVREQEFVVGGFTAPGGSRKGLGALHVGTFEGGRLVYRGKVGTGYTEATLRQLVKRLTPLRRDDSPFSDGPRGAATKGSTWVEPVLVAQVRFTEVTHDGRLRHPVYHGLREDKPARDVKFELPIAPAGDDVPADGEAGAGIPPADDDVPADDGAGAGGARPGDAAAADEEAGAAGPVAGGDANGAAAPAAASGGKRSRGMSRKAAAGRPTSVAGVKVTSPDKLLYPGTGITKMHLIRYYETMAEWMLPHLSGRPLTLVRCPAGFGSDCFFQKHFDRKSPPTGIALLELAERDGPSLYGTVGGLPGIVALVQLGALELHTWNSRRDRLERPDRFIIDIDPDPGVDWSAIVDAALHVRDLLHELGLVSFLKTTGGKGLHVVVPIDRRTDWAAVKAFSGAIASLLAAAAPHLYTTEMAKARRKGRILLDYLRNARGATAIEAYSTRNRAGATVAAPIHWDELAEGVRADSFTVSNMPARMRELGEDPWADLPAVRQSLTRDVMKRVGLG